MVGLTAARGSSKRVSVSDTSDNAGLVGRGGNGGVDVDVDSEEGEVCEIAF